MSFFQSVDTAMSSEGNSSRPTSAKPNSKKMPSLSFKRPSTKSPHRAGAPVDQQQQVARPEEPVHLAADQFPGGDAMLEALTRFQRLQDSFNVQLQVSLAALL